MGREFTVLLPLSDAPTAKRFAQILNAEIGSLALAHGQPVTSNFGVAQLCGGETATQFIARADEALYRAKHNGRNRVE